MTERSVPIQVYEASSFHLPPRLGGLNALIGPAVGMHGLVLAVLGAGLGELGRLLGDAEQVFRDLVRVNLGGVIGRLGER